jgi:cellulose synthase/poly-beta-1,6-N-acetylglucosamine synthase-like glycosyltransferase
LAALGRSKYLPFECIVVDDGSSDDSAQVADEAAVRVLKTGRQRGPAAARNLGVREALGEILVFLDADVCVHEDALERIADAFASDTTLDAIIGSYDDSPACPGFCSQFRNLMHCFVHQTGRRQASTFWTGCGAVRKYVFVMLGGFDERYRVPSMEDVELGYRMAMAGRKVILDRAVLVKHLKEWRLVEMLRTDVVARGLPWTQLVLRYRKMPNDLNLRWSQRLSVAMAWGLAGLPVLAMAHGLLTRDAFATLAGVGAALCLLALLLLNLPLYMFLSKVRGLRFALAAAPLHWCHHFLNGFSFLIGIVLHLSSLTQLFPKGRFRRVIDSEARLLDLESSLAKAADLGECWARVRAGSRDFGFEGVRMSLAGMLFHDASYQISEPGWQLRIALSETEDVNFFRSFDADLDTDPLILGAFVGSIERGLRQRRASTPGKIAMLPETELTY